MIARLLRRSRTALAMARIALRGGLSLGGRFYALPRQALQILHAAAVLPRYEPDFALLLARLVRLRPGAFLDVGANTGQTLLRLLECDPDRPYLGIEPQPRASADIATFIAANRLGHCRILTVGLSDADGIAELGQNSPTDVTASLNLDFRPVDFYHAHLTVPIFRGDRLVDELGLAPVGIVKIDVEGAEHLVLDGLAGTIARDRPFVIFEVLPDFLVRDGTALSPDVLAHRADIRDRLGRFFADRGYRLYLTDARGGLTPSATVATSPDTVANYVAAPEDVFPERASGVLRPIAAESC